MSAPRVALPECPQVACFHQIEMALRNDPDLKRVVKTWVTWTGEAGEANALAPSQAPYLEIEPDLEAERWFTTGTHRADLMVKLTGFTRGTRKADALNLWHAVRRALFPGTGALLARIKQAGGLGYGLSKPQFSALQITEGAQEVGFPFTGQIIVEIAVESRY